MFPFKFYQFAASQWGRLDKPIGLLLPTNRFLLPNLLDYNLFNFCFLLMALTKCKLLMTALFYTCTLYSLFMESIRIKFEFEFESINQFSFIFQHRTT